MKKLFFVAILFSFAFLFSAQAAEASYNGIRMVRQGSGTDFGNANLVLNSAESAHFRLLWGNGGGLPSGVSAGTYTLTADVGGTTHTFTVNRRGSSVNSTGTVGTQSNQVTDVLISRTLRNLEVCYAVFVNTHGFRSPARGRSGMTGTTDFKINMVIQNTGIRGHDNDNQGWGAYAGIDSDGYPFMMMVPAALGNNSNVISHEFMHCIVFANGWRTNDPVGPWHEAVANYGRDLVEASPEWRAMAGNNNMTENFNLYMQNLQLTPASQRAYYQAWPFLIYLTTNPDNLTGYNNSVVASIIRDSTNHEPFFRALDRIFPNADFKDTLGHYAKRLATQDIHPQRASQYRDRVNSLVGNQATWQQVYTILEATGRPNTYAVPTCSAPQAAGINLIPISITAAQGQRVEVTLNGLTNRAGADWRFAIAIENNSGVTTYSNLARPGQTATIVVPANVSRAFVTVTATPTSSNFNNIGFATNNAAGNHRESAINWNQKNRYPYEITITGATRLLRRPMTNPAGRAHPNGGGWVANSATVDATAFVGPNARVLGSAQVRANAIVDGYAFIEGNAQILNNARVDGFAYVGQGAIISNNAHVSDRAVIRNNAVRIRENAKVLGSPWVYGNTNASGNSIIQGLAELRDASVLTGQAIADGDLYYITNHESGTVAGIRAWYESNGNATQSQAWVRSRPFTNGMHYGYSFNSPGTTVNDAFRFNTNNAPIIPDTYHSTYGVTYGSPLWETTRTSATGVLTLNGTNQYVNLNRNVAMFRDIEIQTAVLWRGGAANQKVFHFGDATDHMFFTPSNADGRAEFVLKVGSTTQRLTANAPLPIGRWSIVSIRIIGSSGTMAINVGGTISGNTPVAIPNATNASMSLNPVQISNKLTNDAVYSLGRDQAGNFFNGSYDYFNVFFQSTTAPTYAYTAIESAAATPSIAITPSANHTFPQIRGNATPVAHSVSVSNTSTVATGALTVALSGANATSFTLSRTSIPSIASGGTAQTFTITPNAGLSVGTYRATVTVSGTGLTSRSFTVEVSVVSGGDWVWCLSEAVSAEVSDGANAHDVVFSRWGTNTGITLTPQNTLIIDPRPGQTDAAVFNFEQAGMNISTTNYKIHMAGNFSPAAGNFRIQGIVGGPGTGSAVAGALEFTGDVARLHNVSLTGGRFDVELTIGPNAEVRPGPYTASSITGNLTALRMHTNANGAGSAITFDTFRVTEIGAGAPTFTITTQGTAAAQTSVSPSGAQIAGTTMTVVLTAPNGQRISGTNNSIAVTGTNVANFNLTIAADRTTATGTFNMPANNATITVNATFENLVTPIFSISLDPATDRTFPAATVGYGEISAHSVTVRNTGNQPTGALRVALSGANASNFALSRTSITSLAANATQTFTVRPHTDLAAGTYNATVVVSSDIAPTEIVPLHTEAAGATISTSGTVGWENHNEVRNSTTPASSNPGTNHGWGTWDLQRNGSSAARSAFLQYAWPATTKMNRAEIYWYDDNGGTRIPTATTWAIQHSNNGTTWTDVNLIGATNYNNGRALNHFNVFEFQEIEARYLRIHIWGFMPSTTVTSQGTGVLRFRVFEEQRAQGVASQSFNVSFTVNAPQNFNVTFDPNGGTRASGGQLSQTVAQNAAATAPVLTRAGFVFGGWNRELTNITANTTITANWLRIGAVATGGMGDVTSADAVYLAQHLVNPTNFPIAERRIANMRGDDRAPVANDILVMIRWLTGIPVN